MNWWQITALISVIVNAITITMLCYEISLSKLRQKVELKLSHIHDSVKSVDSKLFNLKNEVGKIIKDKKNGD